MLSLKAFMKNALLFVLISLLFPLLSWKKNNECVSAEVTKTIVKAFFTDTVWGIKLNNEVYPADFTDSIPAAFQDEGLKVCV